MMVLKVKEKEYKVKFGYNSFCDTDLMDRTTNLLKIFQGAEVADDRDVFGLRKVKDLFNFVRDLLFVGFQKHNPVENVQEIGNILDDYREESTEEDKRGLLELFTLLTEELMNEGFLSDLMEGLKNAEESERKTPKVPQDHKKPKENGVIQK